MNKSIYAAVAAVGLSTGILADEVPFSQLPASVQTTINRNLDGGVVKEIEREVVDGRTLYEVEIRREGDDRELWVDSEGNLIPDTRKAVGGPGLFEKGDGKILGIPTRRDNDNNVDAEIWAGENRARIEGEVDIDKPRDRGITEDVFDKNDGRLLNVLPAPDGDKKSIEAEADLDDGEVNVETRGFDNDLNDRKDRDFKADTRVDLETDDKDVEVTADADANSGEGKGIFRKGDGKILGIPIPGRQKSSDAEVAVDVETDKNRVTTDADGGLDTDDNDGRILGVPKRGFENVPLARVPEPVRQTLRREARGGRIAEIELATVEGQQVFEVDLERDGLNRELHIAPDGRIIKDSDADAVGNAPGSVKGESNPRVKGEVEID